LAGDNPINARILGGRYRPGGVSNDNNDLNKDFNVDSNGSIILSSLSTLNTPQQQALFDYVARTDSNPVYIGSNTTLTALISDPTWRLFKFSYDGSARVTQVQATVGAWTNRTTLLP
jgi:hypothetical protein